NVGCGSDVTFEELAREAMQAVGFNGRIEFDTTKPDGTPQKLLDVGLLAQLGWRAKIGLREGLASTYQEFLQRDEVRVMHAI
ncbi:GDP-L-fucose synthase, partial [Bacillus sp. SIMBA_006]